MTAKELAKLAVDTLDAQRAFFRAERGTRAWHDSLDRSKALEKQLRRECERILDGQPSLFGESDTN